MITINKGYCSLRQFRGKEQIFTAKTHYKIRCKILTGCTVVAAGTVAAEAGLDEEDGSDNDADGVNLENQTSNTTV